MGLCCITCSSMCQQAASLQETMRLPQAHCLRTSPDCKLRLQEPPKEQQLLFRSGRLHSLPRLAFCILQIPPELAVIEALVDMRSHAAAAAVVSWVKVG